MPSEHRGTILLVEDEADLRFLLSAHLRAASYDVLEAGDGLTAVALAVERKPDLIIMDVGLPAMDGIAATRAIKADDRSRDIPVIMLTARGKSEDVVKGLEAGAQEYLRKPFEMTELLARVQSVYRLAVTLRELDLLNAKLEAQVDVKTKRLQVLYDFMRALHQTDDQDTALDLMIHAVEQITHARRISLLLRDADGENLVCKRAIGIDPAIVDEMRVHSVQGIAGQVFTSGKTFSAKSIGTADGVSAYQTAGFLSTPLVSTSLQNDEGVLGVLNITEKPDDEPFSEEEIECVRSVTDAAAIALDNLLRRERMRESVKVLLKTVGHLAEYRDEETTLHLNRVGLMARILATELARRGPYANANADDFIEMLVHAAPMHDIGKVGIADDILTKPGKLTDEEFQIMKTHTDIGRRVLMKAFDPTHPVPLLKMCIDIAYSHHEKYNGKGYPRRLKGDQIPLSARIIALVDAYDAITSERRYSKARSHEKAVEIIRAERGEHFDPAAVDAFLRCHEAFHDISDAHSDTPETVSEHA